MGHTLTLDLMQWMKEIQHGEEKLSPSSSAGIERRCRKSCSVSHKIACGTVRCWTLLLGSSSQPQGHIHSRISRETGVRLSVDVRMNQEQKAITWYTVNLWVIVNISRITKNRCGSLFQVFDETASLTWECGGNHLSASLEFATFLREAREKKFLNLEEQ